MASPRQAAIAGSAKGRSHAGSDATRAASVRSSTGWSVPASCTGRGGRGRIPDTLTPDVGRLALYACTESVAGMIEVMPS